MLRNIQLPGERKIKFQINGMLTGGGIEEKFKLKPFSIETPYRLASSHPW